VKTTNAFPQPMLRGFHPSARALLAGLAVLALLALLPGVAFAQSGSGIQVPFVQEFGCSIVQWLKGPLAILIFVMVVVVTLVMGMITKMDWGRIITICIIFGILIGLGSILSSSNYIQNIAGMSACLQ
jgi:type IV secretory pathway VirB2 component (pilin)